VSFELRSATIWDRQFYLQADLDKAYSLFHSS
jgi:hypothetical protein